MADSFIRRVLNATDESTLRAFWRRQPEAHLFAIPDLDFLGWEDERLSFIGWFDDGELVAYLMLYGISAQWSYTDERVAPDIAYLIERYHVLFVTGMEATAWPVLDLLPTGSVQRFEPSTVAYLPAERFDPTTAVPRRGEVAAATLEELDALTAVHVAAPDQFNNFDYADRRRALRGALTDGWRHLSLARAPGGQVVAAAQSTAEGNEMAVIGGVVTHPAHRGQGYATAATAHLCAGLLARGKTPYLFYRRGNFPAARVYEKIGFVPLGDALLAELGWGSRIENGE